MLLFPPPTHTLCVCGGGGWVPQVPATTTSGGGRNYFYYIKRGGGLLIRYKKCIFFFDPCLPRINFVNIITISAINSDCLIKPILNNRLFIFWSVFNRQYTHFDDKYRILCARRVDWCGTMKGIPVQLPSTTGTRFPSWKLDGQSKISQRCVHSTVSYILERRFNRPTEIPKYNRWVRANTPRKAPFIKETLSTVVVNTVYLSWDHLYSLHTDIIKLP